MHYILIKRNKKSGEALYSRIHINLKQGTRFSWDKDEKNAAIYTDFDKACEIRQGLVDKDVTNGVTCFEYELVEVDLRIK